MASRTRLKFQINDRPLFSLNTGSRHELEEYGAMIFRPEWGNGLVLTVLNTSETLMPVNQRCEISISTRFEIRRIDLPSDPSARLPIVVAEDPTQFETAPQGGPFRFISRANNGSFKHKFRLKEFFTTKPVLLCVDIALDTIPRQLKPVGQDTLAIKIVPPS